MIVTVPALSALTSPVLLTDAIAALDETQGFILFAVADPVNCEVLPTHALKIPVIVGAAFIDNVAGFEV